MLTCKQMTDLVTDFEERRMPWIDRARFHLHLLTCRHCREYLAQMRLTVATLARLPRESRQGEIVTLCQGCSLRHPPFPRRAAFVSLAVGSCLTLINQGDSLLAAQLTPALAWKIPLTYACRSSSHGSPVWRPRDRWPR